MLLKTVEGFTAAVGEPHAEHGWNTANPTLVGHIYRTSKLKQVISAGVWDSVTGQFLMYPDPKKKDQYKLVLNKDS